MHAQLAVKKEGYVKRAHGEREVRKREGRGEGEGMVEGDGEGFYPWKATSREIRLNDHVVVQVVRDAHPGRA